MPGFSNSFLLFFYQIALGGLFALAATPFHELDRAFYKSTGGVLFIIGLLGLWGKSNVPWENHWPSTIVANGIEILFHVIFLFFFACYLYSLWGERRLFRARSFALSLFSGLVGLALSSHRFYHAPVFSLETLVYPLSFLLSALLLGSVTVGMLLGHWYLIDTGQTLKPFIRIFKFFIIALIVQSVFLLSLPLVLFLFGSARTVEALQILWQDHSTLLFTRALVAQVAPLILSFMIWRTLQIPHTMAATGLFYIALLGVFVGEILGRQILTLTSLPF